MQKSEAGLQQTSPPPGRSFKHNGTSSRFLVAGQNRSRVINYLGEIFPRINVCLCISVFSHHNCNWIHNTLVRSLMANRAHLCEASRALSNRFNNVVNRPLRIEARSCRRLTDAPDKSDPVLRSAKVVAEDGRKVGRRALTKWAFYAQLCG